jgi:hypothetical protein
MGEKGDAGELLKNAGLKVPKGWVAYIRGPYSPHATHTRCLDLLTEKLDGDELER